MNPFSLQATLIAGLVALIVMGTEAAYIDHLRGQVKVFKEREAAQKREQASREAANFRAKERADANFEDDKRRAASSVVRTKPAAIIAHEQAGTGIRAANASCIDRRELDRVVAGFAEWHAEELNRVVADFQRQSDEEATRIARLGEVVAAAYRACRGYVLEVQ